MRTYMILFADTSPASREILEILQERGYNYTFTLVDDSPSVPKLSTLYGTVTGTDRIRRFLLGLEDRRTALGCDQRAPA